MSEMSFRFPNTSVDEYLWRAHERGYTLYETDITCSWATDNHWGQRVTSFDTHFIILPGQGREHVACFCIRRNVVTQLLLSEWFILLLLVSCSSFFVSTSFSSYSFFFFPLVSYLLQLLPWILFPFPVLQIFLYLFLIPVYFIPFPFFPFA
jgi:hypothetical protein